MKSILSTACVLLSVAALADTPEATPKASQSGGQVQPSADQLLNDVVARLPTDPIHVSGELIVRKRRGVPVASFGFELNANWGDLPARASYHIRDAFGRDLEQLTITHASNARYDYAVGSPPQPAGLPDLSGAIQQTDLSWTDLTLAYLWWRGGAVVGEESIRTFDCYILDIPAPQMVDNRLQPAAEEGASPSEASTYSRVRLWIGKKAPLLLQAEGYGADGKLLRKLWVKSCKKIDEQWMIKEMEIQRYPIVHRTKLRVNEVETKAP